MKFYHPGVVLRKKLEEMNDAVFYKIPSNLRSVLLEIVTGRSSTHYYAGVLSKYIGGTKELWEKLQEKYDKQHEAD